MKISDTEMAYLRAKKRVCEADIAYLVFRSDYQREKGLPDDIMAQRLMDIRKDLTMASIDYRKVDKAIDKEKLINSDEFGKLGIALKFLLNSVDNTLVAFELISGR